jgi:hypothetical protein
MISRPFILGVEKSMKWLRNILANIKGVMVFFNSLEEYRYFGGGEGERSSHMCI